MNREAALKHCYFSDEELSFKPYLKEIILRCTVPHIILLVL